MPKEPEFDLDKAHYWFGVEFNNSIFPILEKTGRTDEETEKMISMAYASTLHWCSYSNHNIMNNARGENMIATTLTYAGRKESAIHHAKRNYDIVFSNKDEVADFDISYALMVMARANALNKNMPEAKKYYDECRESIENIKTQKTRRS
ncbi:MAG: hypothetical protein ABI543_12670 [Ignavibacteria bacterium]